MSTSLPVFDHITITGYPTSVVSRVNFGGVVVTAIDQFGNTLASYTGSVWFTTSDNQGVLPVLQVILTSLLVEITASTRSTASN